MDLAEAKANIARESANNVALMAAAKVSDLEHQETPESIMLSSMTEEGSKERTDREVVVPWLKFLWEIYRAVLELLHRQSKLEKLYHRTCEKAYNFCLEYKRTHEFRRLCEMMRIQLSNLQKMSTQPTKGNRLTWDWTPDSIEYHLTTRFVQLEVATALELWNEGFRTVEDIYSIIQIGKKTPRSKLMVSYYEKLIRIFLVSENYLFHAYAWYKFYSLCTESRKDIKAEEKMALANTVVIAALCIPSIKESDPTSPIDTTEVVSEKTQRMALLLDFQANPTRQDLLSEIISKGILEETSPVVAALYQDLEVKFQPLTLIKNLKPVFDLMKDTPALTVYSLPLQRIAVLRTIQQLARVYNSVKLDFVKRLFSDIDLSFTQIEKLIIDGVLKKQLNIRIDHIGGCLRFGTSVAVSSAIDTQLYKLGCDMNSVLKSISAPTQVALEADKAVKRKQFLSIVADSASNDHTAALERKNIIEQRKEALERLLVYRADQLQLKLQKEKLQAEKIEAERIQAEAAARAAAQLHETKEKIRLENLSKALYSAGKPIDMDTLASMTVVEQNKALADAQADSVKSKEDDVRRQADQAKRLDYITRALRAESAPIVEERYKALVELDRKAYEEQLVVMRVKDEEDHKVALVEKARLSIMQSYRAEFEKDIIASQKQLYDNNVRKKLEQAKVEHRQRKISRARQLKSDNDDRLAEEAEEERSRIRAEDQKRIDIEQAEMLRRQRQEQEDKEKEHEHLVLKKKREEEERLAKMKKELEDSAAAKRGSNAPTPAAASVSDGDRWSRDRIEGPADSRPKTGAYQPPRGTGIGTSRSGGFADRRTDGAPSAGSDAWSRYVYVSSLCSFLNTILISYRLIVMGHLEAQEALWVSLQTGEGRKILLIV